MKLMSTAQEADDAVEKIRNEMIMKAKEKAPQLTALLNKVDILPYNKAA